MKIIIMILFINHLVFSQILSPEKKLDNFFDNIDIFYNVYKSQNSILTLTPDQEKNLVNQLYELYSFHWVETYNYIGTKFQEADQKFKSSGGNNFIAPPAVKLRVIKESIDKIYGENYSELLIVPYYFRVKVLNIDKNGYYKSDKLSFKKTILTCKIQEVIKGSQQFKAGEEIKISLLNNWDVGPFYIGEEYFFPVKPWNCKDGSCTEYTINLFNNSMKVCDIKYDIYPIINDKIENTEYFHINASEWSKFLNEFKRKYLIEVIK